MFCEELDFQQGNWQMCVREKRDVSQQKKRAEGYATIIKPIHYGSVQLQNVTE